MKETSDKKMKRVSLAAMSACVILYIIVGNIGYCLYGNKVEGNFLLAFKRGEIREYLYILLNGGFLLSFFFSLPMVFFAGRNSFIAIIKIARENKKKPLITSKESKISENLSEREMNITFKKRTGKKKT